MAQLPPNGDWLEGPFTVISHRYTDEEIVRFLTADGNAAAMAQKTIHDSPLLDKVQKAFAHFWCGYFYAHAER